MRKPSIRVNLSSDCKQSIFRCWIFVQKFRFFIRHFFLFCSVLAPSTMELFIGIHSFQVTTVETQFTRTLVHLGLSVYVIDQSGVVLQCLTLQILWSYLRYVSQTHTSYSCNCSVISCWDNVTNTNPWFSFNSCCKTEHSQSSVMLIVCTFPL